MMRSFRDPAGYLAQIDGRIFRFIQEGGRKDAEQIFKSNLIKELIGKEQLISFSILDRKEEKTAAYVLEHPRVAFPSYPYEWAPEMLHAAGVLTMQIAEQLLAEGLGLKDATPYNVLFTGSKPIFVDLMSVEKRDPRDPIWRAYSQFVRMFLLPLLLNRMTGLSLADLFINHSAEGISVEEAARYMGGLKKFNRSVFFLVTLPKFFSVGVSDKIYEPKMMKNPELAQFVLGSFLKRTKKWLKRLEPKQVVSHWSQYMGQKNHYSDLSFKKKEALVGAWLKEVGPQRVLDIGCNTGHFSEMAAQAGAEVVSIDSDESSVGQVWRKGNRKILPLRVNVCRPTPSVGWRNNECSSFLDRARGHFDLLLLLAVIHHMLVSERVPLVEIASLCAELTKDAVIIEYVDPQDQMFQKILHGRQSLHADLTVEQFRTVFAKYFRIEKEETLMPTRTLFLLRKR